MFLRDLSIIIIVGVVFKLFKSISDRRKSNAELLRFLGEQAEKRRLIIDNRDGIYLNVVDGLSYSRDRSVEHFVDRYADYLKYVYGDEEYNLWHSEDGKPCSNGSKGFVETVFTMHLTSLGKVEEHNILYGIQANRDYLSLGEDSNIRFLEVLEKISQESGFNWKLMKLAKTDKSIYDRSSPSEGTIQFDVLTETVRAPDNVWVPVIDKA